MRDSLDSPAKQITVAQLQEFCSQNLNNLQGLIILNVMLKTQRKLSEEEKIKYDEMMTELIQVYKIIKQQP